MGLVIGVEEMRSGRVEFCGRVRDGEVGHDRVEVETSEVESTVGVGGGVEVAGVADDCCSHFDSEFEVRLNIVV